MMRMLAVMLALVLAALCWQSWRLNDARRIIGMREQALTHNQRQLAQKNSQLHGLSILTETNSRLQMRLYAAAEQNAALLQRHRRQIEDLKRENDNVRRWAAATLPADVIRLRNRPTFTGGAAYRDWLSQNNTLPPAGNRPAQ
jgi:LysB family phage lysis regulatory protein